MLSDATRRRDGLAPSRQYFAFHRQKTLACGLRSRRCVLATVSCIISFVARRTLPGGWPLLRLLDGSGYIRGSADRSGGLTIPVYDVERYKRVADTPLPLWRINSIRAVVNKYCGSNRDDIKVVVVPTRD